MHKGKSKLINCCYNRAIDIQSLLQPAGVGEDDRLAGTTASVSNYVDARYKNVFVDTVGYGDVRFEGSTQTFLLFFRELVCQASVGYNWVFLVLRYQTLTQDTLTYAETLEQLLGKNALSRCTIVFTHCKKKMNREKCIQGHEQYPRIVQLLQKTHSVIFGDMDTFEDDTDSSDEAVEHNTVKKQDRRRKKLMDQMLHHIDETDDGLLLLERGWYEVYWSRFTQFLGYCVERLSGKQNSLSELYHLTSKLKEQIPINIYYDECSICLELMVEVWNEPAKACITKCGHIFHYACIEKWFGIIKECPYCQTDLRSLPARILAKSIGLQQVSEPLKPHKT